MYGFVDLLMISAIEKHLDWHAENGSDLEEPPRANAVGAVLVLLHLLECHVEPFGESCLGHASFKAQDADVVADYSISGVALSSGHLKALALRAIGCVHTKAAIRYKIRCF